MRFLNVLLCVCLAGAVGCGAGKNGNDGETGSTENPKPAKPRSPVQRMGTVFSKSPQLPFKPPRLKEIEVPKFTGGYAIWGATGRDDEGGIWFGVAADGVPNPSAHLMYYDPASGRVADHGSVVEQLQAAGVLRDGESQMKIHSKIIQADDGYLYFASMDETGEKSDGSRYPKWGGHLWRYRPSEKNWEHLLKTREALIALGGTGRWVYALGYFQHVLYQYDTQNGTVKKVTVGSVGGHISRNFLVDLNGHVYVPRVRSIEPSPGAKPPPNKKNKNKTKNNKKNKQAKRRFRSTLVEFDTRLRELQEVELRDYEPTANFDSHGIVGFAFQKSGAIVFTTHTGGLWKIQPGEKHARIERIGDFHPQGRSYPSMLFCLDGERYVAGITKRKRADYEWVVYDLQERTATVLPFPDTAMRILKRKDLLLYGSNTRDEAGHAYVAGRWRDRKSRWPVLLQLAIPE